MAVDQPNTAKLPTITSGLAILDVKKGRRSLFKRLGFWRENGPAPIPVTITGHLVAAWGHDDGESREFQIDVTGVKLG